MYYGGNYTRKNNILDLVFTNITDELFDCNITEYKTISDQNLIELKLTNLNDATHYSHEALDETKPTGYNSLNFHKADYEAINSQLAMIDWSKEQDIRDIADISANTFKHHLDKLVCTIPDQQSVSGYAGQVSSDTNSIIHQLLNIGRWRHRF